MSNNGDHMLVIDLTRGQGEYDGKRWIEARAKRGATHVAVGVRGGADQTDDGEFLVELLREHAEGLGVAFDGQFLADDGDVGVQFYAGEPDEDVRYVEYPDGSKMLRRPSGKGDPPEGGRAWIASGPLARRMIRDWKLDRPNTKGGYWRRDDPLPKGEVKRLTGHYEWMDVEWADGRKARVEHDHTDWFREKPEAIQFFTEDPPDHALIEQTVDRACKAVGDLTALRYLGSDEGKALWEARGTFGHAIMAAAQDQHVGAIYVNDTAMLKVPMMLDLITDVPERLLNHAVEFVLNGVPKEADVASMRWPDDGSTCTLVGRAADYGIWRATGPLSLRMAREFSTRHAPKDGDPERHIVDEPVDAARLRKLLTDHPDSAKVEVHWGGPDGATGKVAVDPHDENAPISYPQVIDLAKDAEAQGKLRDAFGSLFGRSILAHPEALGDVVKQVEANQAPGDTCDFCGAPGVVAHWHTKPFDVVPTFGAAPVRYSEPWAACATCDALIERDDWPGLREYAGHGAEIRGDLMDGLEGDREASEVIRKSLANLHNAFWHNKTHREAVGGRAAAYEALAARGEVDEDMDAMLKAAGIRPLLPNHTLMEHHQDGVRWVSCKLPVEYGTTMADLMRRWPEDDYRLIPQADGMMMLTVREPHAAELEYVLTKAYHDAEREAERIVEDMDVPEHLREVAMHKVREMLDDPNRLEGVENYLRDAARRKVDALMMAGDEATRIVDSIEDLRPGGKHADLRDVAIRKTRELLTDGKIEYEREPINGDMLAQVIDAVHEHARGQGDAYVPPEGTPNTGKTTLRYRYVDGGFEFTPLDRNDVDVEQYREAARLWGGDLTEFHDEEVDLPGYRMTGRLGRVMYEKALDGQNLPTALDLDMRDLDALARVDAEKLTDTDVDRMLDTSLTPEAQAYAAREAERKLLEGPTVDFQVFVPRAA